MTECEYYQQLISQRLDGELTAARSMQRSERCQRALPTVRRMRPQISAKT